MKVEVKELKISNELQKKIDMICRFAGVSPNLTSGCVKNIKGTNIGTFNNMSMLSVAI